jgi:hypothetical protein
MFFVAAMFLYIMAFVGAVSIISFLNISAWPVGGPFLIIVCLSSLVVLKGYGDLKKLHKRMGKEEYER